MRLGVGLWTPEEGVSIHTVLPYELVDTQETRRRWRSGIQGITDVGRDGILEARLIWTWK